MAASRLLPTLTLAFALLASGLPAPAQTRLQVTIDMRAEIAAARFDPQADRVGLRGAAPPLSWQQSATAAPDPQQPGLFTLTLDFMRTPAQPLAYKFKIDRPAQLGEGWEEGNNRTLLLHPGQQQLQRAFGSRTPVAPLQRSGHIERIAALPSAFVSPREVQVWLPPGYDNEPARRYPVLYLHDGQNVFDAAAAGAEWQFDETAQRLVLAGEVAPLIIVAVASNADRIKDYTPVRDATQGRGEGGGAAAYGRYLVQELKPLIDARYRTETGAASTSVGGSSLGGLVSMWLLLEHRDTFGAALVVSPSVWWGGEQILRQLAAHVDRQPPPRIWLDVGDREGPGVLQGARRLRQALQARGWAPAYLEQPDAGHDEAAWAERVAPMLRHLHAAPVQPRR